MSYPYDDQNIFAKILRGEIPNTTVLETEHTLAFEDINPAAPVHVLVIPKGPYVNADHFGADASEAEIADFWRTVSAVARKTGVARHAGGEGFRVIANTDVHGVQDVPHFHLHVIGGKQLGRMMPPA
ncbi:HIT domain-containing protein [Rhodobacteraceae bacterium NNCM2]|nr:HIT domain-containing protein [Coraliihabitans acroporae]